jgi:predicted negative regulator of RcsB-dependent stress response
MKKLNNKGFGLVGVLVVIVILAAMGGAGAYVYHKHHKAKATTTSSSTSSNTNSIGKSGNSSGGTQASPKTYTSNDALNLVQTAYTTALTYLKQTTRADQGEIDSIKSSLSTGLYGNLSSNLAKAGHDQILCAQAEPDSLTTSLSSSANGTATIYVNELFGSSVTKVTTTVDLSALKITDISCPQ